MHIKKVNGETASVSVKYRNITLVRYCILQKLGEEKGKYGVVKSVKSC